MNSRGGVALTFLGQKFLAHTLHKTLDGFVLLQRMTRRNLCQRGKTKQPMPRLRCVNDGTGQADDAQVFFCDDRDILRT